MVSYTDPPPVEGESPGFIDSAETFAESDVTVSGSKISPGGGSIGIAGILEDFSGPTLDWSGIYDDGDWSKVSDGVDGSGTAAELNSTDVEYSPADHPALGITPTWIEISVKIVSKDPGGDRNGSIRCYHDAGEIDWFTFSPTMDLYLFRNGKTLVSGMATGTWHTIRMDNIDWVNGTFDAVVNGTTQATGISFADAGASNFDQFEPTAYYAPTLRFDGYNHSAYSGDAGTVYVEYTDPTDIYSWDVATFTQTDDGETVDVYIEESTDGGSTWTTIAGPISRGQNITADPGSQVRYRVELSRASTANNPTLDSIYRRYTV